VGICSVSYDSVEVLSHFAARKGIRVPMLSDPHSDIIRRFDLFNTSIPETDARNYGIARPGTFVIDERGIIRDKFFEEGAIQRFTMATILGHAFGLPPQARPSSHQAHHVTIRATATEDRVRPANRFTLIVEIEPAPGVHVYAPGAERYGYHPLTLTIEPPQASKVYPLPLPETETMEFPVIGESVPVYTRPLRVPADIVLGSRQELADALAAGSLTIRGRVALQACDEAECYAHQEIPVTWEFVVEPVDTERVPERLRRETASGPRPA
jgi:DsbC/DsbD-like thiol-disulfide interchange protein